MSGVRTVKIANGLRHEYVTQNGRVVRETVTNASTGAFRYALDFLYDEAGHPQIMRKYSNANMQNDYVTMNYVCNAQGDVVKLVYNGIVYAEYSYDAWGNVLTATEYGSYNYAALNPLRYRGYYYDTETGFYYLQSRYYDPIVKRFLNADSYGSTGQGFLGYNMFAYCENNPLNHIDQQGHAMQNVNTLQTDSGDVGEEIRERNKRILARTKYNARTVNMYRLTSNNLNGEDNKSGSVNISFYYPGNESESNIRIWYSSQITDYYEMEAIIEVMMESDLYNSEIFTNTKEQYITEWQAHNYVCEVCSRGHRSFIDNRLIEKAQHVDFGASDWFWGLF